MKDAILYLFCFVCATSAIVLLFTRSVFKAALLLLLCLLSLAAVYILLNAEFVGVAQLLIYAGGVVIVIIFGIMLTTRMSGVPLRVENTNLFSGILISVLVFSVMTATFQNGANLPMQPPKASETISETGMALMTTHVLPFELAGLLLLMALIGAAVLATGKQEKS